MSAEHGSRFWQGLLVGAAAGMLVGVLLAPQDGERTRKELKERSTDLATAGAAIGGLLVDVASDTVSALADQMGSVGQRLHTPPEAVEGAKRVVQLGRDAAAKEMRRLTGTYRAFAGQAGGVASTPDGDGDGPASDGSEGAAGLTPEPS